MLAKEFGPDTWDELNVIIPGGNDGWPNVKGIASRSGLIDSVWEWSPDVASPSGRTGCGVRSPDQISVRAKP